ncbi:MAG TPA: lmo0937 family membrane protein [Bacteroidia bacterium]|nr:lmo0937 family membrane protein [Bacteroidia bacterium]
MKTMKIFKQAFFCIVIFSLLISSCSEQRYTYYGINKHRTAKAKLDKPASIHTPVEAANISVFEKEESTIEPLAEVSKSGEEPSTKTQKRTVAKKVTKAIDQTLTSPFKTFANVVPAKMNKVFPTNSNTMEIKAGNNDGRSLLWVIIVVILILWLLGFLVGNVGSLIHLLLVVALILIILTLLGVI